MRQRSSRFNRRPTLASAVAALLVAGAPALMAQTVRCEGADGKVTYANVDCPTGSKPVKTLPPPDPPTAAEAKAARERAKADQQQVKAIESKRQNDADKLAHERAAQAKQQAARREKLEANCRKLAAQIASAADALDRAPLAKRDAADARLRRLRAQHTAECKG